MMLLYNLEFVFLVVCAAIYYKAAEMEDRPGLLGAGLSIGIYALTWRVLGWGWLGCVVVQVLLAIGIGVARAGWDWWQVRDSD